MDLVPIAERAGSLHVFEGVLVVYFAAWLISTRLEGRSYWYGAPCVTREVAFTLVLMHFGTYLQKYFTRDELDRVLPVVYAGGFVGGVGRFMHRNTSSNWAPVLPGSPANSWCACSTVRRMVWLSFRIVGSSLQPVVGLAASFCSPR